MCDLAMLQRLVVFLLDGSVRFAGRPEDLMAATGEGGLERAVAAVMRKPTLVCSEAA